MEWAAQPFREAGASHARCLDARQEERAHEMRWRFADQAFGEIGNHDTPAIDRVLQMQRAVRLAEDVADACFWLCDGARKTTGEFILIDSGRTR